MADPHRALFLSHGGGRYPLGKDLPHRHLGIASAASLRLKAGSGMNLLPLPIRPHNAHPAALSDNTLSTI